MARFANIEVPADKQIVVALTYVYGIGSKIAGDMPLTETSLIKKGKNDFLLVK